MSCIGHGENDGMHSGQLVGLLLMLSFNLLWAVDLAQVRGVDCSLLDQVEANGGVYSENGIPGDALEIFRDHGINLVRLKLWHSPADGFNNLSHVLTMAQRVKDLGLSLFLDFHYSDTWADPGHQAKPATWVDLDFSTLNDSLYQYTLAVLQALKDQNTTPDLVQIGNEIPCGMLWDDGEVCGAFNTETQWDQLEELVTTAISAVRDSQSPGDSTQICIHYDNGGNLSGAEYFFDHLIPRITDFEIIGLSYYPWWHGSLEDVQSTMSGLSTTYSKKILIAETAYPWTLDWADNTNNIVGLENQLLEGYPPSVAGQHNFLNELINILFDLPGQAGMGLVYWAPDWITTNTFGSPWENLALFDFDGELLSSIDTFDCGLSPDINSDSEVNVSDVILIVDCILNTLGDCPCSDLNQDGIVTVLDIVLLVDLILGSV